MAINERLKTKSNNWKNKTTITKKWNKSINNFFCFSFDVIKIWIAVCCYWTSITYYIGFVGFHGRYYQYYCCSCCYLLYVWLYIPNIFLSIRKKEKLAFIYLLLICIIVHLKSETCSYWIYSMKKKYCNFKLQMILKKHFVFFVCVQVKRDIWIMIRKSEL